jgi:uracil-DNA glycosylase
MSVFKNDWNEILKYEMQKEYYQDLKSFLLVQYEKNKIFPNIKDIFNAFHYTSYADTKVVILGQDPYHTPGVANGLSFSVNSGKTIPPSLKNIYKELENDLSIKNNDGNLKKWAEQGILLLNGVLTVEQSKPNSHKDIGWEKFTDFVISKVNKKNQPVVFVLWGAHAQKKKYLIDNPIHYIIESPHPSPFSADRGFFDSKPFSKINSFLQEKYNTKINFQL